ncbi:MAG: acyltransferase, partial [Acidobacteria bacterium]
MNDGRLTTPEAPIGGVPGPGATGPWGARYAMLDSWRGLSALAVVVQHVTGLRIGDYGVLLFFVISGYCIAAAADSARRRSLGFGAFMWRRVRRIFPPYLLSIVFFALTRLAKDLLEFGPAGLHRPLLTWLQNLTLTQWLSLVWHPLGNAYDNPVLLVTAYWSLCYEEQFYLVMGLFVLVAARRRLSITKMAMAVGAVALAWNLRLPALATGIFAEYWVHFLVGLLAYERLARVPTASSRRALDGIVGLVVLGGAAAWGAGLGWTPGRRYVFREWVVVGAFYFALVLLRRFDAAYSASLPGLLLGRLGTVTYSLYLVHTFNLTFCRVVTSAVLP